MLLIDLRKCIRRYGTNWPWLLRRLAFLHKIGGFHPREALGDGLLDPMVTETALIGTISRRDLERMQDRVNPLRMECLTEDKVVFYAYCTTLGLPIPRQLGVVARNASFQMDWRPLVDPADWRAFVDELPREFVVKPNRGVYGRGVEIFRRDGDGFMGSAGGWNSSEGMKGAFFTDSRFSSFIVQERLYDHPELRELSGTEYLQTVRMVSDVDEKGTSRIAISVFRIIAGDAVVDNFDKGRHGNLCSLVNPSDGTLSVAIGAAPDGIGLVRIPMHPGTHLAIEGFRLPYWKEACDLVRRAAVLFSPIRTLGWDVALTSDGPKIVETNRCWDPVNIVAAVAQFPMATESLAELLGKLRGIDR